MVTPRKHNTGEWSGGLMKFIGIMVLLFVLLPQLMRCAQEAPQRAADLATQAGNEIADAATDAISSAADAALDAAKQAACDIPVVGGVCMTPQTTAPPGSNPCMTLDEAAAAALALARAGTYCAAAHGRHQEFAGHIYTHLVDRDMCFGFDGPTSGSNASASTIWDPAKNPGKTLFASYHSHPMRQGDNSRFSVTDLCNYVANKEIGYVVGTDHLVVPKTDITFGGDDREARMFVPNGQKFSSPDIRTCMLRDSLSSGPEKWWLDLKCPWIEVQLNSNGGGAGIVSEIPDVPDVTSCPGDSAVSSKAVAAGPPPTDALEKLAKACSA